jgi:hypothetical protein
MFKALDFLIFMDIKFLPPHKIVESCIETSCPCTSLRSHHCHRIVLKDSSNVQLLLLDFCILSVVYYSENTFCKLDVSILRWKGGKYLLSWVC